MKITKRNPTARINISEFINLLFPKRTFYKKTAWEQIEIVEEIEKRMEKGVALQYLMFDKPAPFHISHFKFHRKKLFIWAYTSLTLDYLSWEGAIIPEEVIHEIEIWRKNQSKNSKKKNAPNHPASKRALEKKIRDAIIPVMGKYFVDDTYTVTDLKKENDYLLAIQSVTAHFNQESKAKVQGYPSDSVLQRAAAKYRSSKKIRHKNARKD